MDVIEHHKGKAVIFDLTGRLDSQAAPEVEAKMMEAIEKGTQTVVLNFRAVSYISSAGIRVLVHCTKECEKKSGRIVLASVPKAVENVLYITGFLPYFQIFESTEKALAHSS